jgi:hypothetical protein
MCKVLFGNLVIQAGNLRAPFDGTEAFDPKATFKIGATSEREASES